MDYSRPVLSEVDVLIALLMNKGLEYMEMKKFIQGLVSHFPEEAAPDLLKNLVDTKKPHLDIERAVALHEELPKIIEDLKGEGFEGLIIVGNEVFPVNITSEGHSDHVWMRNNESEVAEALAKQCMFDLNKKTLKCEVVLFKCYGFSEIPIKLSVDDGSKKTLSIKRSYEDGKKRVNVNGKSKAQIHYRRRK